MQVVENRPGESARVHKAIANAFRAHWKAHGNKYPQKLVMPHNQERMLSCYFTQYDKPGTYWGVPIEIDPSSPGVMIAIDGTVMPFADDDPQEKEA